MPKVPKGEVCEIDWDDGMHDGEPEREPEQEANNEAIHVADGEPELEPIQCRDYCPDNIADDGIADSKAERWPDSESNHASNWEPHKQAHAQCPGPSCGGVPEAGTGILRRCAARWSLELGLGLGLGLRLGLG